MDVLSLVRQATTSQGEFKLSDGHYSYDKYRIPELAKTCFKRSLKSGGYYTLRDVIFFHQNATVTEAEYRRSALTNGITVISFQDKEKLKSYLNGVIDTCEQLDSVAKAESIAEMEGYETGDNSLFSTITLQQKESRKRDFAALLDTKKASKGPSQPVAITAPRNIPVLDEISRSIIQQDALMSGVCRTGEFPVQSRKTILNVPGSDYSQVLKTFHENVLKVASSAGSGGASSKQKPAELTKAVKAYDIPIIIVPSAPTSAITLSNVFDFLGMAAYHPPTLQGGSGTSDGKIFLTRKLRARCKETVPANYTVAEDEYEQQILVVDSPVKLLKEKGWENRVVAVFITGQAWQFKGWPISNPVELFEKYLGVHLAVDDRGAINANVVSWSCHIIKISASKRHLDSVAVNQFWTLFQEYVTLRKPWLMKPLKE